MNQPRSIFSLLVFSLLLLVGSTAAIAQGEARPMLEPSYEVSLQVLIGSNDVPKGVELPASLSNVTRQLKNNFSFTHYRLANTFLGRIANNGNLEYKSISDILGQETDADSRTFLEWSFGGFRTLTDANGRTGFQAQTFRFGAKVPVKTGSFKDDTGKINPVINYEPIGLNMNRMGLPENTPTLAGTLSLPNATGTIFLVITVKSANM